MTRSVNLPEDTPAPPGAAPPGAEPGRTVRDVAGLVAAGLVSPGAVPALEEVARQYATAIPPAFAGLITRPDDPIGLQVVPDASELTIAPHERMDPIGDDALSPVPGIVHRYADRALLKPLLVCPLYCRFCFRREHVGPDGGVLDDAALERALDWLRTHPAIREVILTGGDPLMLSPRRLGAIVRALGDMPHVTTIRIHSRVPVADPGRITDALADAMETDRAMWVVVHANHAREFTPAARAALRRIQARAIPVLGQSVLLRGVNDSVAALEALFRAMVEARMKPYYLHQLDAAPGTARFHVPIAEGRRLLAGLRGRVTGLAWPTYTLDIPGGYGKVPLGPDYLEPEGPAPDGTGLSVRDPAGGRHKLEAESAANLALGAREG
ncbi:lysine 2,3-aminomutase YodO family protein [Gluconacetobacter diazotrophicus PA1 5]|uniref:Lysine-2,3-aminomutase-like protein n=2 Tax=Gluconacetobacter diazotrophicus TaxID=33996 RepID=A0A7W4FC36_GLUDI|nr:lysine-2,3-aminomutase-like protein [Gluconacetobacter diazotrophicus]ACI51278.1 lysine 2,3-aminomutase YodO family protein [Gluconacetobacter diazotrophicus PA1 5]MBB2155018.1 lysine-2,3-aminomutase-like protein [Gluconacetobacter diazotrophicus]TWB09826.1 lysine 2,3-aminomutase [Gluconacetobacter diazotrophicus]CAP54451.1 putative L-lysine 2,3-aminomutase [Gluconacetobacter diazotrophicus PA1 5]